MNYSLYVHIPFCKKRCGYCDFNTYSGQEPWIPAYVEALGKEIQWYSQHAGDEITLHTIYFGGGTPSLLKPEQVGYLLEICRKNYRMTSTAEITLEANPGTITVDSMNGYRQAGINRISLGIQSTRQEDLSMLGRIHTDRQAEEAVHMVRKAGFDRLSLDLMYGLPGQTLEDWSEILSTVMAWQPEHLSLYALTVEEGTPLAKQIARGELSDTNDDLAAEMYETAEEKLDACGYSHYEISNWGRRTENHGILASQHNLQYWLHLPYIGAGAGAHGFIDSIRTENILSIQKYMDAMNQSGKEKYPVSPASAGYQVIDEQQSMQETMMVGLRLLNQGVSEKTFQEKFGLKMADRFAAEIQWCLQSGLVEWFTGMDGAALRLTKRGHLLGNQVFMQFVGD